MPLKCGYPRTISSSEFMTFLQWFLPRYFILCCPLVDKFFHTLYPVYQEIHQLSKCIQNMITFFHLCPSPSYHHLSPVLILCPAIWYPSFHPVPLQLILKMADSMILQKDRLLLLYFPLNTSPLTIPFLYTPCFCYTDLHDIP